MICLYLKCTLLIDIYEYHWNGCYEGRAVWYMIVYVSLMCLVSSCTCIHDEIKWNLVFES